MCFLAVLLVLSFGHTPENTFCIVVCDAFCFLLAYIVYVCHLLQYFCNVCAFVSFATIGDGRQIGRICFQHDAFQWYCSKNFRKVAVLICQDTSDSKHETLKLQQFGCFFFCSAKAMKDATWEVVTIFCHDVDDSTMCRPCVYNKG